MPMLSIWILIIDQRVSGAEHTRSLLLAGELARRGHRVTLFTSAWDHIGKVWHPEALAHPDGFTRADGIQVRFLRGCGYGRNISLRRFVDHWLVGRAFAALAPGLERPDVVLASMPDQFSAQAAVRFSRENRIPVVVDIRDKWPDIFWERVSNPVLAWCVRKAMTLESRRCNKALQGATALVSMMKTLLEWGLWRANRPPTEQDAVFYLAPFPKNFDVEETVLPPDNKVMRFLHGAAGKTILSFVGTFNKTQHPALLLDAMALVKKGHPDLFGTIQLCIGGQGLEEAQVESRAREEGLATYLGWLQIDELLTLLRHSHIGAIPMNYQTPTFNNKSFSYLASGLPILNASTGELAVLIEEHELGVNVPAGNPAEMAKAIVHLAGNGEVRNRMRRHVKDIYLRCFDQGMIYARFADHVEAMAGQYDVTWSRV